MAKPNIGLFKLHLIFLMAVLPAAHAAAEVPAAWDWRDVDGVNYVSGVRAMGNCGACFIFAPVAMVESRVMIERSRRGLPVVEMDYAEQTILSCGEGFLGPFSCDGGYVYEALTHLRDVGVPPDPCHPYTAEVEVCPTVCPATGESLALSQPVTEIEQYLDFQAEEWMQQEIYDHGPLVAWIDTYADMIDYQGGIFAHTEGAFYGSTTLTIVGWGQEGATPYWIVKAQWGPYWGEDGFIRILRDATHAGCNFGLRLWTCTVHPGFSPVVDFPQASGGLAQNHPNPFNPATTISYTPQADGPLNLAVFDAAGHRVRTLVTADHQGGRTYSVVWRGRDDQGRPVTSGVYFYRLDAGPQQETRRMVLLR